MAHKFVIIDTCILCVWMQVPGKDVITRKGEPDITIDHVKAKIEEETALGNRIVLPLAAIIECGNHITHIKGDAYAHVQRFADLMDAALDGVQPWDVFTNQSALFEKDKLKELVQKWRDKGCQRHSMGDASIAQVADFYSSRGYDVEIYTADELLQAYQPAPKPQKLLRNRNRR